METAENIRKDMTRTADNPNHDYVFPKMNPWKFTGNFDIKYSNHYIHIQQ